MLLACSRSGDSQVWPFKTELKWAKVAPLTNDFIAPT